MQSNLNLRQRNRSLWLTLPQPSLTHEVLDQLDAAITAAELDPTLRALIISGSGKYFCIGMDIDFLGACFADPTHTFSNFVTRYHELLHRIEEANIPIIAAVNGIARAGGIELLLACDLVVISNEAKIGDHHLASGIPPGAGAGVRLQRILGPIRAREFIFSARWMSADEAFQSGVASHVCAPDQIEVIIDQIVDNLSRTSRTALAATKSALLQASPTRPGCKAELKVFLDFVTNDPDASEGYRAWVEKRSPQWK